VHKSALVCDGTITAHEYVVRHRLPKHLDLEHIRDDLLCLPVDVWVHQGDIVVAGNNVPEC
jgi:hypothetical protein